MVVVVVVVVANDELRLRLRARIAHPFAKHPWNRLLGSCRPPIRPVVRRQRSTGQDWNVATHIGHEGRKKNEPNENSVAASERGCHIPHFSADCRLPTTDYRGLS